MSIYDMKLHEKIVLSERLEIIRVPGGWIYFLRQYTAGCADQLAFVPFNNEFQEE